MATGGHHNDAKEVRQKVDPSNHLGDRTAGLQWTSLTNNLEINLKSKHTKKKRNKDKGAGSMAEHPNSHMKMLQELCFTNSAEASKRNINVPTNQQQNESLEDFNMPIDDEAVNERLANLQDCISQVNSVLHNLKQSSEPRIQEQTATMENILEDLLKKRAIIQSLREVHHSNHSNNNNNNETQVSDVDDDDEEEVEVEIESPSFNSNSAEVNHPRDLNERATFMSDEEKANMQNRLMEKMKISQEKLSALKEQQTLLLTLKKNAEAKLASFRTEMVKNAPENPSDRENPYTEANDPDSMDDSTVNDNSAWNPEYETQQSSQNSHKPLKNLPKRYGEPTSSHDEDNLEAMTDLQMNLDTIKQRLEALQQISDDRNTIEPESPNDAVIRGNLSERLVAVEWQRKKLKNRLLELQEKKKASDELLHELSVIKEAASAVQRLTCVPSYLDKLDVPQPCLNDENEENAVEAMRETITRLQGMIDTRVCNNQQNQELTPANFSGINVQQDMLSKQNSYKAPPGKRDNIKKGQKKQFPARRHYEAEGRANEDPDVPTATLPQASSASSSNRDVSSGKTPSKRMKQQLLQTLLETYKGNMGNIPAPIIHALTALDDEEASSINDTPTFTDNEDSQENDDSSSNIDGKPMEMVTLKVKEESQESPDRLADNNNRPEAAANFDELHNLEKHRNEREQLEKLQEKFSRLHHKFSSSPKQNNEETRSRAEGGNLQLRKPKISQSFSLTNHLPPRQENLLTRQNLATVESQSRNNSANLSHRGNTTIKKDNINDLSAKLNKSAHGASDLLSKFRIGVKVQDTQQRVPYDDIVKQDRNKLQNYSRNCDVPIHSNSSMNSEPLDGSSVLAPDTTVAATWGGSSTQENFEDENELFESMEEHEEGSNNEDAMAMGNSVDISMNENMLDDNTMAAVPKSHGNMPRYSKYLSDSSKRRDNRLHKYFKSTDPNQWATRKNFAATDCRGLQNSADAARDYSGSDQTPFVATNTPQASAASMNSTNPMPIPEKFVKKLHEQLEQLNALCRPVLQDPQPPMSAQNVLIPPSQSNRNTNSVPLPSVGNDNAGHFVQPSSDLMQSYTQQLQLQQQLLLSLSQCYHVLYMQQLEIQHLRCLQQGTDSELQHQQQGGMPSFSPDDFSSRPWFLTPWMNSHMGAVPFPGSSQVSPMSAPPFLQPMQSNFTFSPTVPNTVVAPPRPVVSSVQPARAVVHPAAQDSRLNSETLNNQIPPRTRANNFLDNFRSYAQQNLLSTNTSKGKEGPSTSGGPQVRQVHPLVSNERNWSHLSRVFVLPHTEGTSAPATNSQPGDSSCSFVRPVTNSQHDGPVGKSKRPNFARPIVSRANPDSTDTSVGSFCSIGNAEQPYQAMSEMNTVNERAAVRHRAVSSTTEQLPDSIQAEMTSLLSQNDGQEGCIEELLRELRNLKSGSLQRALGAVRDVAKRDRNTFTLSRNFESDAMADCPEQLSDVFNDNIGANSLSSGSDSGTFKLPDNALQRNNQNWPLAAIVPLGKHVPKPSTGAVKKRPSSRESTAANSSPVSILERSDVQGVEAEVSASRSEPLDGIIERVMRDLISFVQCHMMDNCCTSLRAKFVSKTIDLLKQHSNIKLSPEFLTQLYQTLMQLSSKFSGAKWFECESELLNLVANTLYQEISALKPAKLTQEENSHSVRNPQPDVLPSSSKSFGDLHKQMIPNKEHRDSLLDIDGGSPVVAQDLDNMATGEASLNLSYEDMPVPCNGAIQVELSRGAVGGNSSPPPPVNSGSWKTQAANAAEEDEVRYECDPEAEGDPEADLAEADQSPGQQANGGTENWHPCIAPLAHAVPEENNITESGSLDVASNMCLSVQAPCSSSTEEVALDDIPTKLTPLSQEELQRQMVEEQEANLLLADQQLDSTDDLPLAGSADALKHPPTFI